MLKRIFCVLFLFFCLQVFPAKAAEQIDSADYAIWHFDEMDGVIAYDSSLSQNNLGWGTNYYGGGRPYPNRVPGKWDLGINFSQYEEHYYLERSEPIDFSNGLSLGLWVKTDYASTDKTKILWLGNYFDSRVQDPSNFILFSLESGRVVLDLKQDKDWQGSISSQILINDNNWHFITAVFDVHEQRFYLYLDGQAQGSAGFDLPLPALQRMSIGRREYYYDPLQYNFSGTIDDLWLRRSVITPERQAQIYNSNQPYKQELNKPELAPITVFANHDFDHLNGTVALDNSLNHYDLIWGYNPYSAGEPNPRIVPGKFDNGVNFKKVWDTYAMRLDNAKNFDEGISLGIWIKTEAISTDPSRILWFGNEMNSSINNQAIGNYFRLTEQAGKLTATLNYFDLYHQDSRQLFNRQYNASSDKFISDNEWHQITISLDPRPGVHAMKLYIDGELQSETFFPNAIPSLTRLYLAHREVPSTGTEYNYAGDLDDLFVLNSALKPEEVQDIYQSNQAFTWPIQKKRNPVIIVPGIMGSAYVNGKWELDPILSTYDNLWEALKMAGYEEGKDLFAFPYQWRDSNVISAARLKEKIDEVKKICNCSKVDIVAHSMGGLVARYYIEEGNYENDINKLIFLATPHRGSSKAYLMWEGGDFGTKRDDIILQNIFSLEAKTNGYYHIYEYIKNTPVKSVQELLPIYSYIRDKDIMQLRQYPTGYPVNLFLENLNHPLELERLANVEMVNIIADFGTTDTMDNFKVIKKEFSDGRWEHGYPENYGMPFMDYGIEFCRGDNTVPLRSNDSFYGLENVFVNSDHSSIVTDAQKIVIKELTGVEPTQEVRMNIFKKFLMVRIFSPADFVIIAPDGKRLGKDFAKGEVINEIDKAFYSGFDTDEEFAVIPSPLDGEYKVELQGTGSGEYTLSTSIIDENTDIDKNFSGTISPSENRDFQIEYNSEFEEVLGNLEPIDTVSPAINLISPKENESYLHSDQLKINYTVTDDFSGVALSSVMIDGKEISTTTIDLFDYSLGEHILQIVAYDKNGNQSQVQINFSIISSIDSTFKDIEEIYQRGWFKKISDKSMLEIFLKILQTGLAVYNKENEIIQGLIIKTRDNNLMSETVKQRLISQYQKILIDIDNRRINFINQRVNQIKNKLDIFKKNNQINSLGYDIILSDINYLRINL